MARDTRDVAAVDPLSSLSLPQDPREPPIPTLHVLTVRPRLPHQVLDAVLSGVESGLLAAGASRVWIETGIEDGLSVMADLPDGAVPVSPPACDC